MCDAAMRDTSTEIRLVKWNCIAGQVSENA
jgi:hypothetical protein